MIRPARESLKETPAMTNPDMTIRDIRVTMLRMP